MLCGKATDGKFAFNSSVLDQGLPKGGYYSTRTANATSEDSQQGWCLVWDVLMWFGLGWGGLLLFVGLKSRFALGRELRIPREAWPLGRGSSSNASPNAILVPALEQICDCSPQWY